MGTTRSSSSRTAVSSFSLVLGPINEPGNCGKRRREIDKARRVFLLLAQLLAGLGNLLLELLELLLNVGREVGYLE